MGEAAQAMVTPPTVAEEVNVQDQSDPQAEWQRVGSQAKEALMELAIITDELQSNEQRVIKEERAQADADSEAQMMQSQTSRCKLQSAQ